MSAELLNWPLVSAVAFWTYNTRIVLLGTMLLGICAGVIGAFMVLRKRALVGDVIGHSALPGIGLAFLLMEWFRPGTGRSIPGLMAGALVTGLLGAMSAMRMERSRKVRPDAALALVLSLFYGAGIVLFSVIQRVPAGNTAGLKDYLAGKPSSLMMADVLTFGAVSVVLLGLVAMFFKELLLTCFDSEYATAGGWPVKALDGLLIVLVAAVTVLGMQSVGLILVVSLLLTPASAARFWTDDLRRVVQLSGLFGGISAVIGVLISASWSRLGAGAMIVLSGVALFLVSLLLGQKHGLLVRWKESRQLQQRILRDDVLRAVFEIMELRRAHSENSGDGWFRSEEVLRHHSWNEARQRSMFDLLLRQGILRTDGVDRWGLTERGMDEARKTVRLHRLWEIYLLESANAAEGHVDLHADVSEHFLDPNQLAELEARFGDRLSAEGIPASPHTLG